MAQLESLPHCGWTTCLCLGDHLKAFQLLAVLSHGSRCLTSALGRVPLDHLLLHGFSQLAQLELRQKQGSMTGRDYSHALCILAFPRAREEIHEGHQVSQAL